MCRVDLVDIVLSTTISDSEKKTILNECIEQHVDGDYDGILENLGFLIT